jgi:hypothetical protein
MLDRPDVAVRLLVWTLIAAVTLSLCGVVDLRTPEAGGAVPAVGPVAEFEIRGPANAAAPAERGRQFRPNAIVAPPWARCPEWWQIAADIGWPVDELWHVDRIMWGESRCRPDSWVIDHDDHGGGLMGINIKVGIGTRPFVGPMVDWDWGRLRDPAVNLMVGLAMADNAVRLGQCRWRPWTTRDRSVCG